MKKSIAKFFEAAQASRFQHLAAEYAAKAMETKHPGLAAHYQQVAASFSADAMKMMGIEQ